jgi:hypothetical protein
VLFPPPPDPFANKSFVEIRAMDEQGIKSLPPWENPIANVLPGSPFRGGSSELAIEWRIAPHGSLPAPRPVGFQSHHGVSSVWADKNIPGYCSEKTPAVLMKTTRIIMQLEAYSIASERILHSGKELPFKTSTGVTYNQELRGGSQKNSSRLRTSLTLSEKRTSESSMPTGKD